jgi:hypothetical protein
LADDDGALCFEIAFDRALWLTTALRICSLILTTLKSIVLPTYCS